MIRLDAVTLKQLRALQGVARTGSITAAAHQLRLTPPAVHTQIKGLEAALATRLLTRNSDSAGSQLTAEGQVVLTLADRIAIAMAQCGAEVQALARGQSGRVTLGVVSTGKYFAPRMVKRLNTLLPDLEIVLRVGNRTQVIADLAQGAVDLAVMGRPPRAPQVTAEPLGPHPHGLIAPADHPLARLTAIRPDDLLDETFLAREQGSGTRILMTRYLDRLGDGHPFTLTEMGSNETIKQAAMAGLGIAFLSLHTVVDELAHGSLVLLNGPGLPIVRNWFLVWPQRDGLRAAAASVRGAIMGMNGSYLPEVPAAEPYSLQT